MIPLRLRRCFAAKQSIGGLWRCLASRLATHSVTVPSLRSETAHVTRGEGTAHDL